MAPARRALVAFAAVVVVAAAVWIAAAGASSPPPAAQVLPELRVRGSHYEIGRAVGSVFAAQIRAFTSTYANLALLMKWFGTPNGQRVVDEFLATNERAFPAYMDELRGLAEGSGVAFNELFVLNLEAELGRLAGLPRHTVRWSPPSPQDIFSCTDVLLNSKLRRAVAHNEDANAAIRQYAAFVHAVVDDPQYPNNTAYEYHAYTYPGFLAGNTFGYNSYGLVQTTNALFPTEVVAGGLARQFINRDMLAARTVADALARATVAPRATGFSANLASLYDGTDTMLNLEVSAEAHSVFVVTDHYYHFNMYRHLNVSQEVDESTVHREARAEAMPAAETMSGALQILGDTADKAYPIYRNGAPPDTGVATVATALFDLTDAVLAVYTTNPLTSEPVAVYDMRF